MTFVKRAGLRLRVRQSTIRHLLDRQGFTVFFVKLDMPWHKSVDAIVYVFHSGRLTS